jgi:hypothetical protein
MCHGTMSRGGNNDSHDSGNRSQRWDHGMTPLRHVSPAGFRDLTERMKIDRVQTAPIQPAPVAAGAIADGHVGAVNMGTSWWQQPEC